MGVINIADLKDPNDEQGRTYREVNAEKKHMLPLGTLVELETGERAFIKKHTRDCDQTPLYSIGRKDDEEFGLWHGYHADSLNIII